MRERPPLTPGLMFLPRPWQIALIPLSSRICPGLGKPVLAEGHIDTPEKARQAVDAGAWAVCVGSAITRPHLLTEAFTEALGE